MNRQVTELDLRKPEFQDSKLKPEHFEFDADGNVVRKDRFEKGMRRVHGALIEYGLSSSRTPWTVDEVVEKVKCALEEAQFIDGLQKRIDGAVKVLETVDLNTTRKAVKILMGGEP